MVTSYEDFGTSTPPFSWVDAGTVKTAFSGSALLFSSGSTTHPYESFEGLGPLRTRTADVQLRSRSRSQHHQTHDRCAADGLPILDHRHRCIEAFCGFHEFR